MTEHTTEIGHDEVWEDEAPAGQAWALVIAWYRHAPKRVGEISLLPERGQPRCLGRGGGGEGDAFERTTFVRPRPGRPLLQAPLTCRKLSRRQLELHPARGGVRVVNVGRCPMIVNGQRTDEATLRQGDTVYLEHQLVLLLVKRPNRTPTCRSFDLTHAPRFGCADDFGIVGESAESWVVRDQLAFMARRAAHLLILGPSGVGKELAARAVHAMSSRSTAPWIARNAATIPEGLVDAELFGNIKDYPNPGMRERRGLIGEADRGTLFLDEIGELPEALQAHLLRVLDAGGEYQRLGDAKPRTSDFRLVAATNRPAEELKHDLSARLPLRMMLSGLNNRREDIPLLARHILERIASEDEDLGRRFFEDWGTSEAVPRLAPELLIALLGVDYTTNTRQLEGLLWTALASSPANVIALTDDVKSSLPATDEVPREPGELTVAEIRAALDAHDGHRARAASALGLKNRDVLYRLMKKHGLLDA